MTRGIGPCAGSVAFRLLSALAVAPEGVLTVVQLLPLLALANRTRYKLSQQADALDAWHLVLRLTDGLQIVPNGRAYLRLHAGQSAQPAESDQQDPAVPPSMALPRTAPVFKPLNMTRLMRGRPQRPGMDDWHAVPSLMGGARVLPGSAK